MVVEGVESNSGNISSGVPQGSVLGPLLFLIFINDLAPSLHCPSYMFADDVKIIGNPATESLQLDLQTVHKWTIDWDLPLNMNKCQRLMANNIEAQPLILGLESHKTEVPRVTEVKDLGVKITADFKSSMQCQFAAKKARSALYLLTRTMASRDPQIILPLYKSHVRPHLEYCIQAWSPLLIKDKDVLEKVQKSFTKIFPHLRQFSYKQRLDKLNLFSLSRRRLRGDLIETFKFLKKINQTGEHLFSLAKNTALRGHPMKLDKKYAATSIRAHFFSNRVVNAWNSLPSDAVSANSVVTFKAKIDRCWSHVLVDFE